MKAREWRVGACERKPRCAVARGRRMGRVISRTEPLNGAWGRMQSLMVSRLPQMCRSVQDDLIDTFTNVIGAIFAAVMQRAVVYAI